MHAEESEKGLSMSRSRSDLSANSRSNALLFAPAANSVAFI